MCPPSTHCGQFQTLRLSAVVRRMSIAAITLIASAVGLTSTAGLARSPVPKRMADGKLWTAENVNTKIGGSYCYQGLPANCDEYGRLYTWKSALRACRSLGRGWRLPTDADWRTLAKQYGGVSEDSFDDGRRAYAALSVGGGSGFDALLAGGQVDGQFGRLGAHGFYWTRSESAPEGVWFYNFAKGKAALYRQSGGDEKMAIAVRCVNG